jgi:hypothetical protein
MTKLKHKKLIIFLSVIGIIALIVSIAAIINGLAGIKAFGDFITLQILGMKWLNSLLGIILIQIFGNGFLETWYGASVQFFLYDTIKIIFLLLYPKLFSA